MRYGGIQVQLRGGYSTELITQLNAHQLDLCFISAREGGHDWLPIGYDELTAWVPAAHPMAWLPALPVAAFAKEPYIETYPDKDIDNARRPPLRLCGHPARRAARLLSSLFICALSERRVRRRGAGACDRCARLPLCFKALSKARIMVQPPSHRANFLLFPDKIRVLLRCCSYCIHIPCVV